MVSFFDNFTLGIALTMQPGPLILELIKRGLKNGTKESFKTAAGAFCAESTYFILICLGFSRFIDSPVIQQIFGIVGGLFLLFLSYENFSDFKKKTNIYEAENLLGNAFLSGFTITFFNPANFFMWVGIIGGFFAQNTTMVTNTAVLLGIFLSLLVCVLFSKIGKRFLDSKNMKYVSLFAAIFLLFYGLKLIFSVFHF